jgi:hypothetical protein
MPTWEEWCAGQRRTLRREEHQPTRQQESPLFSERELARLLFERWLYQRRHPDALDPARTDTVWG